MENRNGLVVAAEASQSATSAEREVALKMIDEQLRHDRLNDAEREYTLGADKQYQDSHFVVGLRQRHVAPHVAEYESGINQRKNSLTEAERADERRSISQRKRKLIERVFGWPKLDRPLRQVKLRGLRRVVGSTA